jgi:hypothetical protein
MPTSVKNVILSISLGFIVYLVYDSIFPRYVYYNKTIVQSSPSPIKNRLTKEEYNALVGRSNLNSWYEKEKQINYYAIGISLAVFVVTYLISPFKQEK